jgi:hypothetical protein
VREGVGRVAFRRRTFRVARRDEAVRSLPLPGRRAPRAPRGALVALWLAEAAALVALIQLSPFFRSAVASVSLGAALGGAGSNLADRLWRPGVVDVVDLRIWPVLNLADVAIVGGAVIGALHM